MTPAAPCASCGIALDSPESRCPACGAMPSGTTELIYVSPERDEFEDLASVRIELDEALASTIEIVRPLARGGMGAVFLARDRALKRQVVVKVLSPALANDPTARERFAREAESSAAVSHPNVVGVFQVGELPRSGTSYLVMQHIDGPSLGDAYPMGTKLLQSRCRRIVGEIASALAAAHGHGLVHRDIKPGNVILEGPTERAIVLDFGISAALTPERNNERLTQTGTAIGTPEYMSPEHATGEDITGKSDIYSLGVVAFELLAGRPPFDAATPLALLAAHMKDTAPRIGTLRPDLDADFAQLVDRMLAKRPEHRPPAAEVARALLPGTHIIEWPPPGLERLRGRAAPGLRWLLAGVATLAVYFLALALRTTDDLWWVLINTAAALTAVVAIVTAGLALGRTNKMVQWSRRSGYPYRIALDVALDAHNDTAALLNGAGRFASLGEGTGWRWLARRRRAAAVLLTGIFLSGVLVALWAAGRLDMGPANGTNYVTLADVAVIFAPTLVAFALATILRLPETRVRRYLGPPGEAVVRDPPLVAGDLVSGWLSSVGLAKAFVMRKWRRRIVPHSAELPLAVFVVVTVLGLAASLMSSVYLPVRIDRRSGLERDQWARDVRTWARAPGWRSADGIVARSARMALGRRDLAAARAIAQMTDSTVLDPGVVWGAFRLLPGKLPDSVRIALADSGDAERAALWSRVRAAGRLPALWHAPEGALVPDSLAGLGHRLATVQRQALRHAGGAALQLERGDRLGATRRAREIISMGRVLWSDPLPEVHFHGIGALEMGARVLAAIGLVTGDRALARESDTLRATLDARRIAATLFERRSLARHAASPEDTLLAAMAGDRGLAPVDRWAIVTAIAEGACWNPAEIRSGVSPLRYASLQRAAEGTADIAHSAEWVSAQRQMLDRLQSATSLRVEGSVWSSMWPKPVLRSAWCSGVRMSGER